MTVPVWLMDVDGVLNIIGWGTDKVTRAWGDTTKIRALKHELTVSTRMLAWINRYREEGLVDLRWLTTWEEHANSELAPKFGWPELPIAGRYEDSRKITRKMGGDIGWWKLEFAQAIYDTGVPLIWTDDDIVHSHGAQEWLSTVRKDRVLAIAPPVGLTPEMMYDIGRFANRWRNDQST